MDDMQNQMSAILSNPDMMQKIMAMAQSLNQSQPSQAEPAEHNASNPSNIPKPDIDISMLQKLSGFAGQSHVDSNQRTLLSALAPYLARDRISKLEKAMRAAKMANLASAFLSNSGFRF